MLQRVARRRIAGPAITHTVQPRLFRSDQLLAGGLAAALLSGLALAWRGRAETGSAVAPINAAGLSLHGRQALRQDAPSWRYTGVGGLAHAASSLLWSGLHAVLRERRERRGELGAGTALLDAAAVTAVAAVVDFKLVPDRLSPGFQHRLSTGALVLTYASFAAGLLLADRWRRR